ncbi:MAG: intradiol ring-cleavage dioxygenase, partial [Chloroflexota bacterium]
MDGDDDDRLIGRVLTRREVLALFGMGGAALAVAACAPGVTGSGAPATTSAAASAGNAASSGVSASAGASSGASAAAASSVPSCVVVPELTEGP